jgi:hypothetical protein
LYQTKEHQGGKEHSKTDVTYVLSEMFILGQNSCNQGIRDIEQILDLWIYIDLIESPINEIEIVKNLQLLKLARSKFWPKNAFFIKIKATSNSYEIKDNKYG